MNTLPRPRQRRKAQLTILSRDTKEAIKLKEEERNKAWREARWLTMNATAYLDGHSDGEDWSETAW